MSADYMLPVLERLADSHRVILPDQRGTRTSARPPVTSENYAIAKYVADLEAVREHLGIERWAVLGHSWGGTLAMAYACSFPWRVSRMLLIGTCGPTIDFLAPALEELGSRASPQDPAPVPSEVPDEAASNGARASLPLFFRNRALGDKYAASQTGLISTAGVFGTVMKSLAAEGFDLRPRLKTLRIPTLVIHGDYDHIPIRFVKEIVECIPSSSLMLVQDCGHFPWIEAEPQFYEAVSASLS